MCLSFRKIFILILVQFTAFQLANATSGLRLRLSPKNSRNHYNRPKYSNNFYQKPITNYSGSGSGILELKIILKVLALTIAALIDLFGLKFKILIWLVYVNLIYHFWWWPIILLLKPLVTFIVIVSSVVAGSTPVVPVVPPVPVIPPIPLPMPSLPIILIAHDIIGSDLTVTLNGNDCYDIPPTFITANRLGSINTNGQCLSLFEFAGCTGQTADLPAGVMGRQFPPNPPFPAPVGDYYLYSIRAC